MTDFRVKPLDETTWPDFAVLVERHNGVWCQFGPTDELRIYANPPPRQTSLGGHDGRRLVQPIQVA